MTAQVRAVGPDPGVAELLVGSLTYSSVAEVNSLLRLVHDDDVDPPLDGLIVAVRSLAAAGVLPSPQLVADELRRTGKMTRSVGTMLAACATTGACASAARHYAAAVVAIALRRKVESFGSALTDAAASGAEDSLRPLVERASAAILETSDRLVALREVGA